MKKTLFLFLLCLFSGMPRAFAEEKPFHATEIVDANFAQDFRLKDTNGKIRILADWRGKVVLLFFGYTHCPDVCPTTLLRIAQAVQQLGETAQKVQVLFVTLDPARDSPGVLREYATAFHPSFIGLYTSPQETQELTRNFRIFYRVNPGRSPKIYSIDHSVQTYVYDPKGRLRLAIGHDATAENIAADLKKLLKMTQNENPQ